MWNEWARACIFADKSGQVIFQLILLPVMGMLLQINDTKQSESVFYFVVFCLGT